jgi:serine/threonine-protein kinase
LALTVGSRLGSYEILGALGAGGMGEVYRATDTTLKRAVAIKVLPASMSSDTDRLARFQREAELLASLNHPNIAQIYGIHQADGSKALVMELVDGPTLADRIVRGPIPLTEALAIAKQIADAFETAHEHGIVHRDLKPANIKVREDGTVKVLDFGLAKALDTNPVATSDTSSHSQTSTSPAMTHVGMILGTAAYMSPEQARGKVVDARADVWAFGCVLYEMVTSKRAFAGDDVSDALASVLAPEPNWKAAPRPVVGLLKKCLEKDPRKRLRHIGDWELLVVQQPDRTIEPARRRRRDWLWPAATAVATAAAIAIAVAVWKAPATPAESPRLRINPQLPSTIVLPTRPKISVAPDGRRAAIQTRGTTEGPATPERIWLWSFDAGTAAPLAGTEGALRWIWSPDARYLAAVIDGALKKFETSGGPAQTIATGFKSTNATPFGGAWNNDNVILLESQAG